MENATEYNYITISKTEKIIFTIIGAIISISTLMIGFCLFYSNFFEREMYINRKKLYKYLKTITIEGTGNTLPIGKYKLYYFKHDNSVALFGDNDCLICSFNFGILDCYYYNKILKIVKEHI